MCIYILLYFILYWWSNVSQSQWLLVSIHQQGFAILTSSHMQIHLKPTADPGQNRPKRSRDWLQRMPDTTILNVDIGIHNIYILSTHMYVYIHIYIHTSLKVYITTGFGGLPISRHTNWSTCNVALFASAAQNQDRTQIQLEEFLEVSIDFIDSLNDASQVTQNMILCSPLPALEILVKSWKTGCHEVRLKSKSCWRIFFGS